MTAFSDLLSSRSCSIVSDDRYRRFCTIKEGRASDLQVLSRQRLPESSCRAATCVTASQSFSLSAGLP